MHFLHIARRRSAFGRSGGFSLFVDQAPTSDRISPWQTGTGKRHTTKLMCRDGCLRSPQGSIHIAQRAIDLRSIRRCCDLLAVKISPERTVDHERNQGEA